MARCRLNQPASKSFSGPLMALPTSLDPHRRAVAVGDDQLIIGIRIEKLVIGVDGIGSPRAVERALRQIDVGLADDIAHVFEADAARGQRLRIDLNPDRRLLLAADTDQADARISARSSAAGCFRHRRRPWSAAAYRRSAPAPGSGCRPGSPCGSSADRSCPAATARRRR